MRHPLMNLVNTTLSQKYGDPQLKVSIYGSVLKSSLYISLIPAKRENWSCLPFSFIKLLKNRKNFKDVSMLFLGLEVKKNKNSYVGNQIDIIRHQKTFGTFYYVHQKPKSW